MSFIIALKFSVFFEPENSNVAWIETASRAICKIEIRIISIIKNIIYKSVGRHNAVSTIVLPLLFFTI